MLSCPIVEFAMIISEQERIWSSFTVSVWEICVEFEAVSIEIIASGSIVLATAVDAIDAD